jgi:hypothetical protein
MGMDAEDDDKYHTADDEYYTADEELHEVQLAMVDAHDVMEWNSLVDRTNERVVAVSSAPSTPTRKRDAGEAMLEESIHDLLVLLRRKDGLAGIAERNAIALDAVKCAQLAQGEQPFVNFSPSKRSGRPKKVDKQQQTSKGKRKLQKK